MDNIFIANETDVPEVETIDISSQTPYSHEAFLHCGWSSPMIKIHGRYAIADQVLTAIGAIHQTRGCGFAGVRFGRGGRRHYRFLTEKLAEIIMASPWVTKRSSDRERERARHIEAFASDLIDLL